VSEEGLRPSSEAEIQLPQAGRLIGRVRDDRLGPVVATYSVRLVPTAKGALVPPVTRRAERFEVGPLRAGLWRVVVTAPGYAPFEQDVEVRGGDVPGTLASTELVVSLQRTAE